MPKNFEQYDSRHFPTVDVQRGYSEWSNFYDEALCEAFDVGLLAELETVKWPDVRRAADLGCGTGKIGAWMRKRGVAELHGVDCTEAMLRRAATKEAYEALVLADLTQTPFPRNSYQLCISVLAVCHVADLASFYAEAQRLLAPGGLLVLLDYHPFFLAKGVPTHYRRPDGEDVAIKNVVHFLSDQVETGLKAGLQLIELKERFIDEAWVAALPNYGKHLHHPVSFAMVWKSSQ